MAAKPTYPSPPEQMVALASQARRQGVPFEDWWETAVRPGRPPIKTSTPAADRPSGCVLWPSDSAARNEWRVATDEVKDSWDRAWHREEQTDAEKALMRLLIASPPMARLFMLPAPGARPASEPAAAVA